MNDSVPSQTIDEEKPLQFCASQTVAVQTFNVVTCMVK